MHAIPPQAQLQPAARWYREPLVHFIALGAVIFVVFSTFGGGGFSGSGTVSHDIHIGKDQIAKIESNLRQDLGHQPSANELSVAIDDYVKDEVMYREGIVNGLDKNDPIIRQRVAQLMKWYMVGLGATGEPTEEELRQRYEAEQEKNRSAHIVCFEQIYFSSAKRAATAFTDAQMTLKSFSAGTQTGVEVAIGHGDSLGGDVAGEEKQQGRFEDLQAKFGLPFVASVEKLPLDRWSGPLQSTLGWHVVKRLRPENPTFQEARAEIRSELMTERGSGTPDASYAEMRKAYNISIDSLPPEVQK